MAKNDPDRTRRNLVIVGDCQAVTRVLTTTQASLPGQNLPSAGVPGRTLLWGGASLSGSGPGLPTQAWAPAG